MSVITAEKARNLCETSTYMRTSTFDYIKSSAEENRSEIVLPAGLYNDKMFSEFLKELEDLGYTVTFDESRDSYIISWA